MPLAFHWGGRWGVVNAGMRIGWPERRGSAVRRETHERRGLGVGAHVATAAGIALTRAHRDMRARLRSGRRSRCIRRRRLSPAERRGLCGLRNIHPQQRGGSGRGCRDGGALCGDSEADARLVVACRHVPAVIIIGIVKALLVRELVGLGVDCNNRRDSGDESRCDEASIAVIQGEVQVVLRRRSGVYGRVQEEGTVLGASRRLSCGSIQVTMTALGKVQDERGSVVPSGGNPIWERVRARHGVCVRVGNRGRRSRGA